MRPRQIAKYYIKTKDAEFVKNECAKYDNPEGCREWVKEYVMMWRHTAGPATTTEGSKKGLTHGGTDAQKGVKDARR